MKYTEREMCLIWLDSFCGLEYKHKAELYKYICDKQNIKASIESAKEYVYTEIGESEYNTLISSANNVYLKFVLDELERKGITAITLESEIYPKLLKETQIPPLVLYAKGNTELFKEDCFSIVGSRKSLPMQVNVAKDYTESLIKAGFTVVTGIAEGVEKAVIETAIENGGKVISVLASGFENVYPSSHISLVGEIAKNGLVITEHTPETPAKPYLFPVRNRIIAGLSLGSVIISGGLKSGTLYTAEYTEEYGRELFAVPYSVGVKSGEGCNDLIKRGARLTDSPLDVIEFFGKTLKKESEESFSKEEQEIIDTLKEEMHVDKICEKLGKKIFEVLPVLSILEIKGKVINNGSNVFGLKK